MRKDSDFQVTDHIRVSLNGNAKLSDIAARNLESIAGKVLADEFTADKTYKVSKDWDINGEKVTISVEVI
jgi:isoleucyl-tRNA synthetase